MEIFELFLVPGSMPLTWSTTHWLRHIHLSISHANIQIVYVRMCVCSNAIKTLPDWEDQLEHKSSQFVTAANGSRSKYERGIKIRERGLINIKSHFQYVWISLTPQPSNEWICQSRLWKRIFSTTHFYKCALVFVFLFFPFVNQNRRSSKELRHLLESPHSIDWEIFKHGSTHYRSIGTSEQYNPPLCKSTQIYVTIGVQIYI